MGSVLTAASAKYRVDNIPPLLKPWFLLYGYGLGTLEFVHFRLTHWTCRIEHEGTEALEPHRNYIYCLWHGDLPAYFCAFGRHKHHAWINHPMWYMKPVHVAMRLAGIDKIILGSTGHGGRAAAEQLVRELRSGASTVIAPDGPAGPARVLKRGVLHIAAQSGVPIVPLRFELSRCWHLSGWDRKRYPRPFSTIRVHVGRPIAVDERRFESAAREATALLS
jgi:lysophospholipid acyltransferase (LPLAT)-like uncharacterized protein